MPKIQCVYGLHFNELANKYRESIAFEGNCLSDLIDALDKDYTGFREELIDPARGELSTRNQILIQREEEKTRPLFSLQAEIQDGDILTFF